MGELGERVDKTWFGHAMKYHPATKRNEVPVRAAPQGNLNPPHE